MKADSNTKRQSEPAAPKSRPPAPIASPTALARVDAELAGLPARQRAALAALATGRGFGEAARSAGITRQTLRNWRTKDSRFAAVYNAWQNEALASAQHRLVGLADDAVTALGDAINTGETHAALELLRRLGILVPPKIGSEIPAEIERDNRIANLESRFAAVRREQCLRADAAMAKLGG